MRKRFSLKGSKFFPFSAEDFSGVCVCEGGVGMSKKKNSFDRLTFLEVYFFFPMELHDPECEKKNVLNKCSIQRSHAKSGDNSLGGFREED